MIITRLPVVADDDLTLAQYRALHAELCRGRSLRELIAATGSNYSPSWWSQFAGGHKPLTWQARNDLRRGAGLPLLPPTAAEALASIAADAAIYRIGAEPQVRRVVLVATDEAVNIALGDALGVIQTAAVDATVTGVTPPKRRSRARGHISLPKAQFERLDALRLERALTWPQLLEHMEARCGESEGEPKHA